MATNDYNNMSGDTLSAASDLALQMSPPAGIDSATELMQILGVKPIHGMWRNLRKEDNNSPTVFTFNFCGNRDKKAHPAADDATLVPRKVDTQASGTPNADNKLHFHRDDIWLDGIFPFLGPGHYGYVAPVCKAFKELYKEYFSTIKKKDLPIVSCYHQGGYYGWYQRPHQAISKDTFFTAVFESTARMEYWELATRHWHRERFDVCEICAGTGSVVGMKWARQEGFEWRAATCTKAARRGHLELVQWLHANGCPWDFLTSDGAVAGGHLEVLKWVHSKGCPWGPSTCAQAACLGHFEILVWLRANDCPWDCATCIEAAKNGHVSILEWASENGCPMDEEDWENAYRMASETAREWIVANGFLDANDLEFMEVLLVD